jgi:hypothetical protein
MTGQNSKSSTTALWQSYQQCHLVAKQEELAKQIINFALKVPLSYSAGFFNMQQHLTTWADSFTSLQRNAH